jgi:putative ABC transport system permease protein
MPTRCRPRKRNCRNPRCCLSTPNTGSKKHPAIYFPLRPADYAQPSLLGATLMVRSAAGADALKAVRREISAMDANITPFNPRSMTEQIDQFMSPLRAAAWTYGLIGVFGLVLAAVGLAGVIAYSVAQRAREIGIRMALGAKRIDVLGLVMKEGVVLVTIGTMIGLGTAWSGMRMLAGYGRHTFRTDGHLPYRSRDERE